MNQVSILSLSRLPARLTAEQTALLLGFQEHDLPALMRAKLLTPLGKPPINGCKYFSSAEVEELSRDRDWLNRASKVVTLHWREMNARKQTGKQK